LIRRDSFGEYLAAGSPTKFNKRRNNNGLLSLEMSVSTKCETPVSAIIDN